MKEGERPTASPRRMGEEEGVVWRLEGFIEREGKKIQRAVYSESTYDLSLDVYRTRPGMRRRRRRRERITSRIKVIIKITE